MKKQISLILLLLVISVFVAGCSQGIFGGPELQVTPALTPILLGDAAMATPAAPATRAPVASNPQQIIIDGRKVVSQRTPVVIEVPITPVVASALTSSPPTATDAHPAATAVSSPTDAPSPSIDAFTPTPLPPTNPPQEPTAEVGYQGVPVSLDETLNILVVGSDERRPNQPWRSDVIMVVAVDYTNRQVGVVSFPRDLYVDIPTVGKNRINTATFFGGVNGYKHGGDIGLLKDTLAQNFGIRIDHYVKFNFETFKDIVDALGGVDIVVDCPITGRFPVEPGSSKLVWQTLQPGTYHMDGEFALRYVRERKTTSDVDRNRRQQRVLIAMRKRAKEVNIVPKIPGLYQAMRDNIETDLSLTDIIALSRLGLQIDTKDVHGFNIGYQEADSWRTPGGASVLLPDMEKINEGLRTLFSKPSILKNPRKPRNCR